MPGVLSRFAEDLAQLPAAKMEAPNNRGHPTQQQIQSTDLLPSTVHHVW